MGIYTESNLLHVVAFIVIKRHVFSHIQACLTALLQYIRIAIDVAIEQEENYTL